MAKSHHQKPIMYVFLYAVEVLGFHLMTGHDYSVLHLTYGKTPIAQISIYLNTKHECRLRQCIADTQFLT